MKHLSALVLMLFFTNAVNAFVLTRDTIPGNFPGKWGSSVLGTGANITWSLVGNSHSCIAERGEACTLSPLGDVPFMPAAYKAELERAFDAWSAVADVTFTEVADGGEDFNAFGTSGDIRVAAHAITADGGITGFDDQYALESLGAGTLAHGFFPPANGATAAGDIHFDLDDLWKIGFGGAGFDIFQVFAHELGHSLGLGHTNVANSLMNPFYTEVFSGLQADDIAGAQFLYGPANSSVPAPQALWLVIVGLVGFSAQRKYSAVKL